MISQTKFLGGARYVSSDVTYQLSWGYRLNRLSTAVPGTVFMLPSATDRNLGGPQIVVTNETGSSIFVSRFGEGGAPLWEILGGYRAKFHLVSAGSAAGTWVADIRQTGVSGTATKLEAAMVGGSVSKTAVLRHQNATDTTIAGATSPNNRQDAASFSSGQELFVGGTYPIEASSAKLDGYRNDSWRQIGAIPISVGGGFGGFGAGLGFLFAGVAETRTYAFDRRGESWSTRTSLGATRSRGASASVDGKVYLIAGEPAQYPSMGYAPLLDSLYVLPTYVGTNRRRQSAFGQFSKVYSCGGVDDVVGTHDLVDILDVPTLTWSAGPVLTMGGRRGGGAFSTNRRGYFGGGKDSAGTLQANAVSLRSGAWASITSWGSNKFQIENSCGAAL